MKRGNRLLVVGASPMRAAAFATWRSMGLDVVLVDGSSTGRYEELVTEFRPLDPRDGKANLDQITRLAETCDGVTTVADDSQLTVATVSERLGRPGVGCAAAGVARSKAAQRALLGRKGMAVPTWRKVSDVDDLREFYAAGDRAAVLKPVDAAGGAGVLRVDGLEQACDRWPIVRSLSVSRTAVIEDFLEGPEVCVDAVVVGGDPLFVSVVDCQHMATAGFLCTAASYRASRPDEELAVVMIKGVASALGLGEGVVHAEFKIGEDGSWVMVETGLRPGGAFVPELTLRVSGINLYEAQARLALGQLSGRDDLSVVPVEAKFAESRYLVGEGAVRRFVPPARILADLPDVRVVNQQAYPGQRMRMPLSEAARAGYAYGWGDDSRRLDAQLRAAIARLGGEMGLTVHGNDPTDPEALAG